MKLKHSIIIVLIISVFTSCNFISSVFTYKDTTEKFVESLIKEEYENSLTYMAIDEKDYESTKIENLKAGLANFRKVIVDNFGKELEYKFMTASKTFSTVEEDNSIPNTTNVQIQFSNNKEFGVFQIIFDDSSNKILKIDTLNIKEQIPNMLPFWLFGIFPIIVLLFNIYVIRLIKRSNLRYKWLKYISVLFFNVPAISYNAINGLSFNLLSFQIMFGFSFSFMGYLNSTWTFGIPLGGLYWLWRLSNKNKNEIKLKEETLIDIKTGGNNV